MSAARICLGVAAGIVDTERRAAAARRRRSRRLHRHGAAPRRARRPVDAGEIGGSGERAGRGGQPLADEDHRAGCESAGRPAVSSEASASASVPGAACSEHRVELVHALRTERGDRDDLRPVLAHGLAQAQEDDRRLFLGLEAGEQHGRCVLERRVRNVLRRRRRRRASARNAVSSAESGRSAEVDVVGAECQRGRTSSRRRRPLRSAVRRAARRPCRSRSAGRRPRPRARRATTPRRACPIRRARAARSARSDCTA